MSFYNRCCLSGRCVRCRTQRYHEKRKPLIAKLFKALEAMALNEKPCAGECAHDSCTVLRAYARLQAVRFEPPGWAR